MPEDTPWDLPYFRYKKNLRNARSSMGVAFDTNNFGFRDEDVVIPKPGKVFRILCIGGSTTEEGPDNARTYPNLLERELSGLFPERRIEVVNCGTSGMTTTAHISRLGEYFMLEPDMIILYEGVNDIHRDLAKYWRSIGAAPLRRFLSISTAMREWGGRWIHPAEEETRTGVNGLVVENLRAIGRAASHHGIRMALCSVAAPRADALPRDERDYFDYCARTSGLDPCFSLARYNAVLDILNNSARELCDIEGYLFIPVAEGVRGGVALFSDLYHMTDRGIEMKAHAVAECLSQYVGETK